jgi:hypothetical protein
MSDNTSTEIIATGELRPERIQDPAALQAATCPPAVAIDVAFELRPERIQRDEAFRALLDQQSWIYLEAEDDAPTGDQIVGRFDAPEAEEIGALARIVLEFGPEHGSRPALTLKPGSLTVAFGQDEPLTDVDVAFAHVFGAVLPQAEDVFHKRA